MADDGLDERALAPGSSDALGDAAEEQRVAQEFEANELIIMMTLLIIALSLGRVLHRYEVRWLPESGLNIFVGFAFGLFVHTALVSHELQERAAKRFFFNHELFQLILLPHIIFEAGYSLPRGLFFTRIGAISMFAVGGTFIATVFTWSTLALCSHVGAITRLTAVESGALAALISAIDPVSTLTLFKLLQVHPELHNLLFGESVLNDAVSIIAFDSIMRYFSTKFNPLTDLPATVLAFLEVSTGSVFMGFAVAAGAALLLKVARLGHTSDSPIVEAGIFWALSYLSFLTAEACELSGIVSSLFCGIGMSRYAVPNLSASARVAVPVVLEVLAVLAETTVFVLVGLAVWAYCNQPQVYSLILVTLFCCFAGRALNIFGLSAILNRRAAPEFVIPRGHQVVMWFSGLRGAIAVTLAVQVPGENHDAIVMTTIVIVLFTTFVLGGFSEALIKRMQIETGPEIVAHFHAERKRMKAAMRAQQQRGQQLSEGSDGSPRQQEGDLRPFAARGASPSGAGAAHHSRPLPGTAVLRRLRRARRPRSIVEFFRLLDEAVFKPVLVDPTVTERVHREQAARHAAARHSSAHPHHHMSRRGSEPEQPAQHGHADGGAGAEGGGAGTGGGVLVAARRGAGPQGSNGAGAGVCAHGVPPLTVAVGDDDERGGHGSSRGSPRGAAPPANGAGARAERGASGSRADSSSDDDEAASPYAPGHKGHAGHVGNAQFEVLASHVAAYADRLTSAHPADGGHDEAELLGGGSGSVGSAAGDITPQLSAGTDPPEQEGLHAAGVAAGVELRPRSAVEAAQAQHPHAPPAAASEGGGAAVEVAGPPDDGTTAGGGGPSAVGPSHSHPRSQPQGGAGGGVQAAGGATVPDDRV